MLFAYAYTHFVTTEVFEQVNTQLAGAEGRGERQRGLEMDVPLMPNNGDCNVRMRFVLLDGKNIMAGQVFAEGITGKWVIFDFSYDEGDFLNAMLETLGSMGDTLVALK